MNHKTANGSADRLSLGTADAAAAIGCGIGQLQRWDENRLLLARRNGHKRFYTSEEVRMGRILARLARCKVITKNLRRAVRGLVIDDSTRYLAYQEGRRLEAISEAEIIDYFKRSGTGLILIDLATGRQVRS